MSPNFDDIKAVTKWLHAHRAEYEKAVHLERFAASEYKRVEAYLLPAWQSFGFSEKHYEQAYAVEGRENDIKAFYEMSYDLNAKHGWKGNREYCPAGVAKHEALKARWAFLKAFFGKVPYYPHDEKGWALLAEMYKNLPKVAA